MKKNTPPAITPASRPALTMREVARRAGVSQSAVSAILNNSDSTIKVSEATRTRVMKVIEETGYVPNAAGRALSMRRTKYLGYILSDTMAGGWKNAFFARIFTGVEEACRKRGYGLNACRYNLSNVDSFVFPDKVGQRSVDGLVLTGYVEAAVVARFREFGIPCVCIGDNLEVARLVPTVADEMVTVVCDAVEYLAGLGHRHIGYTPSPTRRGQELADLIQKRMRIRPATATCRLTLLSDAQWVDFDLAPLLLKAWFDRPKTQRPTALLSSDQALLSLLKELARHGLSCPKDISLISLGNTWPCEYAHPGLTAVDCNLEEMGTLAADLLIDHLEYNRPLTPAMSRNDFPGRLIVRESCGPPAGNDGVGGDEE
jgi:LacI family transcriptional regulator